MTDNRLDRAIQFATLAHGRQTRKGTDIPYITHPYGVAMLLARAGCEEDIVIAGLLHDTVEDTSVTLAQLAAEFGPRVAEIVAGCSEPDRTLPWEARKQHTVDDLRQVPLEIKLVACADKLHNVRSMAADHQTQGEQVWQRFKRGRAEQAWYYRGIVQAFQPEIAAGLYPSLFAALARSVAELFGA